MKFRGGPVSTPAAVAVAVVHFILFLFCSSSEFPTMLHVHGAGADDSTKFNQLKTCLSAASVKLETLVLRGENQTAYKTLNFQVNQCCGDKRPKGYLVVDTIADIQTAVKCCQQIGIRVVPKGGGHSYGKYSFGDSHMLIIDLRNLNSVSVDKVAKTSTLGPGDLMAPTAWDLHEQGNLMFPFGVCMPIGMAFFLGGGYSDFSRLFGIASDSLLEVDMIDASGALLTANANTHPDLFWALRGAGSGSFGIVTRYQLRLHEPPISVAHFARNYTLAEFPRFFMAWEKFLLKAPANNIQARAQIYADSILLRVLEFHMTLADSAGGTKNLQAIIANNFPAALTGNPGVFRTDSYLVWMVIGGNEELGFTLAKEPSDFANITRNSNVGHEHVRRKRPFYVPPKPTDLTTIMKIYSMLPQRPQNLTNTLRALGGVVNAMSPTETAFVHRQSVLYEFDSIYKGSKDGELQAALWLNLFFEETKLLMNHTESFQNHLATEEKDWLRRYYGVNVPRLVSIKKKYDPGNFFRNPQSIPVRLPRSYSRSSSAVSVGGRG